MSLRMRIYYNAVCAALGGLLAWAISGLLLTFSTSSFAMLLLKDALLGSVVGVCIGGALGAVDASRHATGGRRCMGCAMAGC